MYRQFIAIIKIALLCITAVITFPILFLSIVVSLIFGARAKQSVVKFFTHALPAMWLFIMGIKVKYIGKLDKNAGVFISNHLSYLDIPIFASSIGGVFVSKHDIKSWPIIGQFAQIGGTIFINRTSIKSAMESTVEMRHRIKRGARVVFCPEGKIGDGIETGKFKAFLFSAIAGSDILVQPFTIVYTDVYGKEITTDSSKNIYWNDDTPLIKHGLRMLASGPISAELHFHDTFTAPHAGNKDEIRKYAEEMRSVIGGKFEDFNEDKNLYQE